MKEYLLLFRGGDGAEMRQQPEAWQAHMQKWMEWMGGLAQNGLLVSAQPLDTSGRQITGTEKLVTDGPFMEGKEMVGGYLMCKADDYDSAVAIAKNCPILEFADGKVEVREVNHIHM